MTKQQSSALRMAMPPAVAVLVAFFLLQAWAWTARFPWSSSWWLMIVPLAIVLAGLLALVALVFIKLWVYFSGRR